MSSFKKVRRLYRQNLETPEPAWPSKVCRSIIFIHDHLYDTQLTVRWMKKKCKINSSCFATRFLQHKNYYPKEYILYHRKEVAKQLLTSTDISVTMVGISVGFKTVSAFCKTFKRKVGHTPTEWRNI